MTKPKADKRLTPIRHLMEWLGAVATQCATNSTPAALESSITLMASELSLAYPESTFTEESAKAVAMGFQYGWPTVVQMRKAIDTWRKEKGERATPARLLLSEARLADPRLQTMSFEDRSWVACWDKRLAEIIAEGDPLWDHSDPDIRRQSKRANLASTVRTYGGQAWTVIANPHMQSREADEFEFLRKRCENLEPKSDGPVDPRRAPRAEDADLY